jgi:hypothetical protein
VPSGDSPSEQPALRAECLRRRRSRSRRAMREMERRDGHRLTVEAHESGSTRTSPAGSRARHRDRVWCRTHDRPAPCRRHSRSSYRSRRGARETGRASAESNPRSTVAQTSVLRPRNRPDSATVGRLVYSVEASILRAKTDIRAPRANRGAGFKSQSQCQLSARCGDQFDRWACADGHQLMRHHAASERGQVHTIVVKVRTIRVGSGSITSQLV